MNADFPGFSGPGYTTIPNELLDDLMPKLTGAEFKVLCLISRKTFGWHRQSDRISLTQICEGTNLSRPGAVKVLKALIKGGYLEAEVDPSAAQKHIATEYRLRMRPGAEQPPLPDPLPSLEMEIDEPPADLVNSVYQSSELSLPGLVNSVNPQKKGLNKPGKKPPAPPGPEAINPGPGRGIDPGEGPEIANQPARAREADSAPPPSPAPPRQNLPPQGREDDLGRGHLATRWAEALALAHPEITAPSWAEYGPGILPRALGDGVAVASVPDGRALDWVEGWARGKLENALSRLLMRRVELRIVTHQAWEDAIGRNGNGHRTEYREHNGAGADGHLARGPGAAGAGDQPP